MARPVKSRRVGYVPEFLIFKPAGVKVEELEVIKLNMDEIETVRLADHQDMYFEDAAQKMGVSRQTFGNILKSAHTKIADALINGKAIVIEGGDVEIFKDREFYCNKCRKRNGHEKEKCNSCGEESEMKE